MGHSILAKFRLINSSKQFHSLSNLEKEIEINQNDLNCHLHLQNCPYLFHGGRYSTLTTESCRFVEYFRWQMNIQWPMWILTQSIDK